MITIRAIPLVLVLLAVLFVESLFVPSASCEGVQFALQASAVAETEDGGYLRLAIPNEILEEAVAWPAECLITLRAVGAPEFFQDACISVVPLDGSESLESSEFLPQGESAVLARRACPATRGQERLYTFSARRILERRSEGGFQATAFLIGSARSGGCARLSASALASFVNAPVGRAEIWWSAPTE